MTASAGHDHAAPDAGCADHVSGCPGVVAGAVLRSARRSAGLSERALATASGVSDEAIQGWEQGSPPLASVPLPKIEILEASLRGAGTHPDIVADLAAAARCDLVILAIADLADPACLMADPTTSEPAFAELLTWSVAGQVPVRHQPYAGTGPLLTDLTLIKQVMQA